MAQADDLTSAARLATAAGTRHWQTHDRSDLVVEAPVAAEGLSQRELRVRLAWAMAVMLSGIALSWLAGTFGTGFFTHVVVAVVAATVYGVVVHVRNRRRPAAPAATTSERRIVVAYEADPRAASLARFAVQTADEIRRTQTWQSSELDLHRARLDLHEEVRQVARRAESVARARHALPPPASLPMTAVTEPIWHQHALLDGSLDSLHNRVAALVEYRTGLLAYEAQLQLLVQVEQAERVDLSEAVLGAADDEVAGANLAELSAELREAREAVRSTLSTLARLSDPLSEIERD